jgi:hypothetical protein
MIERCNKSVPTEILFVHVTTNLALQMQSVVSNQPTMKAAEREYGIIGKQLKKNFSFIYTVLESIVSFNSEWEKQITVSAAMLAVEAFALSQQEDVSEEKAKDIECILDWTALQYKSGTYRANKPGYKWRAALIFLLLNEVSNDTKQQKPKRKAKS